jgi:signal transduction histidine kinase
MAHEDQRRAASLRAPPARHEGRAARSALACARHDLRSAIHSVLGFADLLASSSFGELNADQTHFVTQLRTSAARLLELADASTDLADGGAGHPPRDVAPLPLGAFLKTLGYSLILDESMEKPSIELDPLLAGSQTPVDADVLRRVFVLGAQLLRHEIALPLLISAVRFEQWALVTMVYGDNSAVLVFASPDELEPTLSNRELVRFKLMEVLLARYTGTLRASSTLSVLELCLPLIDERVPEPLE